MMNKRFSKSSSGRWRAAIVVAGALLAACEPDLTNKSVGATETDSNTQSLLERDAAFAERAQAAGVAIAYREFLASDAVQLPDGDYPIVGREEIYENILRTLADQEISLSWEAEAAEVSGNLGYTWGSYSFEGVSADGETYGNDGKYVNIWRRNADGEWQVILDISNQNLLAYIEPVEEPLSDAGS